MPPELPGRLPIQRIAAGTGPVSWAHPATLGTVLRPEPRQAAHAGFHAPDASFRTCFAGLNQEAAFAEGVLYGPVPTALVSSATLVARSIAELHVAETIRALPLYGCYLMPLGATSTVTHGDDYAVSQEWAKATHDHSQAPDGILYTSRHDERTFSLALFERAAHKLVEGGSYALSPTDLRTLMLLDYGLGLTP